MSWYRNLTLTAKTMCRVLAALFAVLLGVGLVVILAIYPFEKPLAWGLGLLLGTGLSVLKVVLMDKSLAKSVDMDAEGAKNYANLQMMLRYALTIAVLVGAFFFRNVIGAFGVVAGILALQISAYISAFALRKVNLDKPAAQEEPETSES